MMNRRHFAVALGAAAMAPMGSTALAQSFNYAGKTVHFVVAYAAGGVADLTARVCLEGLATSLGAASAPIENRPGAAGNIGTEYVVRAVPDGTTFLVVPSSQLTTNSFVPELRIKGVEPLRQLLPVAPLADAPLALVVPASLGVSSFEQLADKGRTGPLRVGNPGTGTPQHLAALLLERATGVPMVHVPYKGGAPMIADLSGGHIDAGVASISSATALVGSGRLRWLGTIQTGQAPSLPGVPSLNPLLKGAVVPSWSGVFAPLGTPPEALDAIHAAVSAGTRSPAVVARLREQSLEPMQLSRAEMQAKLAREAEFMADFLGSVKLQFAA